MSNKLKSPFIYFGGKSKIAPDVWSILGNDLQNYVEPFAGSLAVLLARPSPFKGPETINDFSCLLINLWRTIQKDPIALAELCVGPAAEVDKEARHYWLVTHENELRDTLGDPDAYDLKAAAFWVKGLNEWIRGGFCSGDGPWAWSKQCGWYKQDNGQGVNRQVPHMGGSKGVNRQVPHLAGGKGEYAMRIQFLTDWFSALRDRLCYVRMICGDWSKLCESDTVTIKHGLTGVFLDPPYAGTEYVYAEDKPISSHVNQWCAENGQNNLLRIVLCGRGTEHDSLLELGWHKEVWSAIAGYSRTEEHHTEALWCSPNCNFNSIKQQELFE